MAGVQCASLCMSISECVCVLRCVCLCMPASLFVIAGLTCFHEGNTLCTQNHKERPLFNCIYDYIRESVLNHSLKAEHQICTFCCNDQHVSLSLSLSLSFYFFHSTPATNIDTHTDTHTDSNTGRLLRLTLHSPGALFSHVAEKRWRAKQTT